MRFTLLRFAFLTLLFVNQINTARANVASPQPFTIRQPNGTLLTLYVRGDEWFHWYETPEGRPAVLNATTGFWVYLLPSAPGTNVLTSLRVGLDTPPAPPWRPTPSAQQLSGHRVWRSVSPQQPHAETVGSIGVGLMPVLLGNFSDTTPTVSASTFSNLLFATGPGVQSMATYYREVSYGKFTVAAGPSGIQNWVTVPNTAAYYGATNPAYANAVDIRAGRFVRDVVVAAVAAGYDFSPYDLDGDGKVDVVCVVHAGLGEDYGGGPNTIWSHRSSLSGALGTNGPVVIQTKRGQIIVDDYIVEPEVQPKPRGASGVDPIGIGVFCHEYGHALGLPDLYDPTYASRGVGDWSVMSYGSHNGLVRDGDCPAHFDAWCKAKLGWLTPVNYTLDYQNVPFPDAAQTPFAARLWKDGLSSSEYFLVENRYRTNFDAALPASGLLIWHIDDSKGALNDNSDNTKVWFPAVGTFPANTNNGNYHVALVQADGLWELETKVNTGDDGDAFPGSSNNRLFGPGTAPNSYAYNSGGTAGYDSYVTVSNVSDAMPVMTADLYTRSPNSGPSVDWVNIAGIVPPTSGALFTQLDAYHPVVIRAFPGRSGAALSQIQLYLTRGLDGRWWNFSSQQWDTNATSSNYSVTSSQQLGLTLAYQDGLPAGTNLLNGNYTFIVRVIDSSSVVTELQMAMTASHAPEVTLSLANNAVVNTLTNFTAVATENSGLGVQRVEVALYWDGSASEGAPPVRWFWSGTGWTTEPAWLGVDFPTHPGQATLYYPIGPDAPDLRTETQYTVSARAVDALGDVATNTLSVFYDPGSPATIYWRYAASGNWFDPANWNPSRVPDASDNAVVNTPGDYTITIPGGANVASLRFGRVVGLGRQHLAIPAGGSLTLGGADTNKFYANATLDLGGSLQSGPLRFSGGAFWNWTNGLFSGNAEVRPGAWLAFSGSDAKNLSDGASILNFGAISWLGGGAVTANGYSAPSWITNAPGGIFQLAADGKLFNRLNGSYQMVFVNAGGLFTKTGGTNTLVDTCTFVNSSEVRADVGLLSFNALLQLNDGGSFTGAGAHQVIGGTVSVAGVTTVSDSTFEIAAGQLQGAADDSGTFNTAGNGRVVWSGGSLLAGTVRVGTNAQMELAGGNTKVFLDGAVLENGGRTIWSDGSLSANGYSSPSYIRNRGGASFVVSGTNTAFRASGSYFGRFENAPGGTLVVDTPGESPWTAWQLINDGTVQLTAGSLRLDAGGASSGSFTNLIGAQLRFAGGTFALHAGTRFEGAGDTHVTGATLTADGYVSSGTSTSSGTFSLDSGTLNGTGFTSLGLFQWNGGTIGGSVSNAPGASFSIVGTGQAILSDDSIFNNAGLAQLKGGRITANGYSAASTWNNLPGARFEIASDGGVFGRLNGSYQVIFNNGAGAWFGKTAGTNSVVDTCQLNNSGELSTESGILAFDATLRLNPGGVFTGSGGHELRGGSAFWDGVNTIQGTVLDLSGTTVTGNTNASIVTSGGGLFEWSGGTLVGTMNLSAGSLLQIDGSGPKILADGAILNNQGTAQFLGAGLLSANGYGADSLWNNLPGSRFEIRNDGPVFGRQNGAHILVFSNAGGAQFTKAAGTNSILDSLILNNSGELRSDSGTLVFDATLNLDNGGIFTGNGRHELRAGTANWSGTNIVQGTAVNLSGATVSGDTNATLITGSNGMFDWSGGSLSGTLSLAVGSRMQLTGNGDKHMADGAVLNNGGLAQFVGAGRLIANGYSAASTWNNLAGARFEITSDGGVFGQANGSYAPVFNNFPGALLAKAAGTNSLLDTCVINNQGELRSDSGILSFNTTLNLGDGGLFSGSGSHQVTAGTVNVAGRTTLQGTTLAATGGRLVGTSSGTFATTAGGLFDWSGGTLEGTLTFAAGGSFRISGSGAKTLADGAILNNSGTLALTGSGTFQVNGYSASSTFNNLPGGVLQVLANTTWGRINGSYRGVLNNAGTIQLDSTPRVFQADWDYTQSQSGALSLLLAGSAPGTGFSQANFAGSVNLDGTLAITLAGSFAPTNTQSFAVLNYGSRAGQFSAEQLPGLSSGWMWNSSYDPKAFLLSITPVRAALNPVATIGGAFDNFQFDVTGPPASSAVIWTMLSGDPQGWQPVYTNSPFSGLYHFTDVSELPLPPGKGRFYRIEFRGVGANAARRVR